MSEDIGSKMIAVTMVTGQSTVPCDSLSNLYSHVQLGFFSQSVVMPNMVVILQYTVIAMQQRTQFSSSVKVFDLCNGGEL